MAGNNRRTAPEGNQQPTNLSAVGKITNFVQTTITNLLPGQPRWVKGTVLFLFVFLFIYIVIVTLQGSMVLPIDVRVALTKQERDARTARGGVRLRADQPAYDTPQPGYQIYHGGYYYGLNGSGHARIDLQVVTYAWIRATGSFEVIIRTPQAVEFPHNVRVAKGVGSIFFDGDNAEASIAPSQHLRVARASTGISFIDQAAAAVSGRRLYLQALAVPEKIGTENVTATLSLGGRSYALEVLTNELALSREASLLVKGGTSTVQDYRAFFSVPEESKFNGASIRIQGSLGFFSRYSEVFRLPDEIELGKPVNLTGDRDGALVLQLAHPVDVIFFERRDTASVTETLAQRLAQLGLATRVNDASVTLPGNYNIIYAGADVPIPVLKTVIAAVAAEVPLRLIQTGIQLRNGRQNQIQIGSNATVSCLPTIEPEKVKRIVSQKTDEGFLKQVQTLPRPSSCKQPA